jgi:hypothetical protein
MKINFQVTDNYALNYQGRHIDLHNNFDFNNLEYSTETMTLVLRWIKSSGDWVKEDELSHLALVHKNVSYLFILPRDPEMPLSEDSCLSDITFFPSSSRDINNSVIHQGLPGEGDDILYIFQSEQVIRVHCEEIELLIA